MTGRLPKVGAAMEDMGLRRSNAVSRILIGIIMTDYVSSVKLVMNH